MKRFGLQIGDVGVEFPSQEDRQKAIIDYTKGTTVRIYNSGIRFQPGKDAFSTYEREDKDILVHCAECSGIFSIDVCGKRNYPRKYSYAKDYEETGGYICDACFAKAQKAKELFDAKKLIENQTTGE